MYLFRRSEDLHNWLQSVRGHSRKIGFVPTMGALHEGHLSLIRRSRSADSFTVCSIFVNPTQFNEASDLEKYPRTPGRDIELLAGSACDVLFMPGVEEVYPKDLNTAVDVRLGKLDRVLEGQFRPGHFAGVVQVVNRLLQLVQPDHLYMGQKDFQQLTIVREMIRQLALPVELIPVATQREEDGLAMSSRNARLSDHYRSVAPVIYQILKEAEEQAGELPPETVKTRALHELTQAGLQPEYFEIVDGNSLQTLESWDQSGFIVACTAVWAGDIRLIDNVIFKR